MTQLATKEGQIRVRVTQLDKERLEAFAKKAGYKKPSDYYRAVLLRSHTVVLGEAGAVHLLIGPECPEGVGEIVREALAAAFQSLNSDASDRSSELGGDVVPPDVPAQGSGQPPAAAPTAQDDPEEGLVGAGSPPGSEAIAPAAGPPTETAAGPVPDLPSEGAGPAAHAPPVDAAPAAGSIPGSGGAFPIELEPGIAVEQALSGGPVRGETEHDFLARRVAELRDHGGRGATVARAEARAEWRQAVGGAPLPAAPAPLPAGDPPPPPAPAGFQCPRCAAVRQDPSTPCPDCGLRPGSFGGGSLGPET